MTLGWEGVLGSGGPGKPFLEGGGSRGGAKNRKFSFGFPMKMWEKAPICLIISRPGGAPGFPGWAVFDPFQGAFFLKKA